jgi:hypothetical protein
MKLQLPEGMIVLADLVAATASVVPDFRERRRYSYPEGLSDPVDVSNRDQTQNQVHPLLLMRMLERNEIVARCPLTLAPHNEGFEWQRDAERYAVTWDDAQAFCRMLAIDLQPLVAEQAPTSEERDASLLAQFRSLGGEVKNGKISGSRGARAALERADGRRRQTLEPILLRAAMREAQPRSPFDQMAARLK